MHEDPVMFADAQEMIEWLNENNIKVLPRQLDGTLVKDRAARIYETAQVKWFDSFYKTKTFGQDLGILDNQQSTSLSEAGRACCGGRQTCLDQNYKQRHFFVGNRFPDWYCSVNHFFLYVKQVTGEIYVNKDCKMNFAHEVGPIGNLDNSDAVLTWTKDQLVNNTMPTIQCKKHNCFCGLCAPKAQDLDTYNSIMKKYQTN
jgi:hypothetical protein